ncbi:MAG: hypothetical protein HQM02_13130, partial [Magnetococcales bacterium]|nr:hypothetical protein [Magnetococcales bacterium]
MNGARRMRSSAWWWLWIWFLPLGAAQGASAQEEVRALLRDKAFCGPENTFPQPAEWVARPVRHDRWARGADLAVTLDQQIYQLLIPFIHQYAREKRLDIRVQEGTCGMSAGVVSRKQSDIAGFCCPPGRSDRLPGLTFHTLGIASIAVLVHPGNPIGNLTLEQVRSLFSGQTRSWSQLQDAISGVPGPPWPIQAIGRLHCKLRPGHWRALLWEPDDFSPRLEEVGTIPDMIYRVMAQQGSI